MSKTAKILVTFLVIFIFFILFSVIALVRTEAGNSTPGILGLIVFAGMIGAVRAIWKSKSNNDNDDSNSSILQK